MPAIQLDKRKYPHQKIRWRKEWKENRERRIKQVNYMCEWCGAGIDKKLTVHHERELKSITYEIFWIRLVNAAINEYLEEILLR